ncbi:MAG TPA: NADH-quinone oxidoreductase subunit L [Rhodanobacteraceae bacterium]|nr:NADH-quinone oxidoreductase subunit L [Rhodanobacteraceae bacterium]
MTISTNALLAIVLAPLVGSLIAGLLRERIGRGLAAACAIAGVGISTLLSAWVFWQLAFGGADPYNAYIYTWLEVGKLPIGVGFMIDRLTALMMLTVTFVSLMVHIYTIGYMADDPGFKRFFSYIALFTFSMLMLVMANNFMQLFFGWEAVGLVSYLLIGFWFKRETAIFANLKAFLVNRVGDFGFIIGIAAVLYAFNTLDYATVFAHAGELAGRDVTLWGTHTASLATVIGVFLFIGAMGKSAQVPLHVWLPDSMEGPTPISALIHAATMVTAGIFMVARMSPLYEMSEVALSVVLVIGATTAFFTGLIAIVQNDIKRVVAYSTLSQLGYMTVALGVSAYTGAIFHLMTHAFFKALLFLGSGSVIIAMHHGQDMRYMGGLRKYMPITWITMWIGSLALVAFPGTSGFFSKDSIIEAVAESHRFGSGYAYWCVLLGVFVTSLYSFRLLYLTFHGKERFTVDAHAGHGHDDHHHADGVLAHAPKESPWVVTVPLMLLAIPSLVIGWPTIEPLLYGGWFGDAVVSEAHAEGFHGAWAMIVHGLTAWPFWLMVAGFAVATWVYLFNPAIADRVADTFKPIYRMLSKKYWMDDIQYALFASGGQKLGNGLWKLGDAGLIDGGLVNGSARMVERISSVLRGLQSGYLYHYAFAMVLGLILLLGGNWLFGGGS